MSVIIFIIYSVVVIGNNKHVWPLATRHHWMSQRVSHIVVTVPKDQEVIRNLGITLVKGLMVNYIKHGSNIQPTWAPQETFT